jgi:hypothetical protein
MKKEKKIVSEIVMTKKGFIEEKNNVYDERSAECDDVRACMCKREILISFTCLFVRPHLFFKWRGCFFSLSSFSSSGRCSMRKKNQLSTLL